MFKYDIDFDRDVTSGDRFSVVVEQHWREGELIRTGPVTAAVFTARGKPFTAVRFERDGKAEYFTADGRPLKKSFIRSPIQYARLSSRFGTRRHPVLGTSRMHKGVDYAARAGTPIMAAGDARVVSSGWQGGYGNAVVLDHGRGYTTLYGHMSRTAGLKRGQRVAQGQVIGYVGSTGMSTGPHLHYEFRINGVHRNPLQHTMPPPEPLSGAGAHPRSRGHHLRHRAGAPLRRRHPGGRRQARHRRQARLIPLPPLPLLAGEGAEGGWGQHRAAQRREGLRLAVPSPACGGRCRRRMGATPRNAATAAHLPVT